MHASIHLLQRCNGQKRNDIVLVAINNQKSQPTSAHALHKLDDTICKLDQRFKSNTYICMHVNDDDASMTTDRDDIVKNIQ